MQQILSGPLFNELMRVETVAETGLGNWTLGLVGARSERFRRISLGAAAARPTGDLGGTDSICGIPSDEAGEGDPEAVARRPGGVALLPITGAAAALDLAVPHRDRPGKRNTRV